MTPRPYDPMTPRRYDPMTLRRKDAMKMRGNDNTRRTRWIIWAIVLLLVGIFVVSCALPPKKKVVEEAPTEAQLTVAGQQLAKAEQDFEEAVRKLKQEFERLVEEKNAALEAVKKSGLSALKAVKSHKAKASKKKDEL